MVVQKKRTNSALNGKKISFRNNKGEQEHANKVLAKYRSNVIVLHCQFNCMQ